MTPGPARRGLRGTIVTAAGVAVSLLLGGSAGAEPEAAEERYERGIELYLEKDYGGAVRELSYAYSLAPRRETLFAWAQAERLQGNCPAAIRLYARYLEQDPPEEQVALVRGHLERCRRLVRRPWYTDVWGDLLVGAGAVGFGVATWFMVSSLSLETERDAAPTHAEYLRLTDEARWARTASFLAAGAGVTLVSAGIARFVLRSSGGPVADGGRGRAASFVVAGGGDSLTIGVGGAF
jgi:tetratricopeptide (TPR) repeat protein